MDYSQFVFYFFAALAIACSLMVVFKKNPVTSAMNLIVAFFSFAVIFAVVEAHLIAALQVLVYAGAIMVLFIFVIMLLNADVPSLDLKRSSVFSKMLALLGCSFLGFLMITKIFKPAEFASVGGPFTPAAVLASGGNTRVISELMFSEYLLPFELTSILLLAAIISAVALAKRKAKFKI